MRFIFPILSIVTGIVGLIFIVLGTIYPAKYQQALSEKDFPSAVQVIQIYTEAMHTVTFGIGIITFAVFLAVIGILFSFERKKVLNTQALENSKETFSTSE